MTTLKRCGYTLIDDDGEQYPCDGLATAWRWYQDVDHEDCLEVACDLHANEGGRRMHDAEEKLRAISELVKIYRQAPKPCTKYVAIAYRNAADDLADILVGSEAT